MCTIGRRDFVKSIGLGTLGLGFGVSIFDSMFQYAEGEDKANTPSESLRRLRRPPVL